MSIESTTSSTTLLKSQENCAGLYLTFQLGREVYGLQILKVQEIIGLMAITHVPRMPGFVRGVINLRGKVIPVVDLRLKFGMETQKDTDRTCVVVVQISQNGLIVTMGLIVDEVSEVLSVASSQIEPPPSFGTDVDTRFILGMGKVGDRVIMLLDVDRILNREEIALTTQDAV
jgi:purine-binding chemotaxis protein CheW